MGLSLKKAEMIKFLEEAKQPDEEFSCMLWGTVMADLPLIEGRTFASTIMQFMPVGGVAAMPDNAFCYIGVTQKCLYTIAVDSYNTSKVLASFALPFDKMKSLTVRKSKLTGSYVIVALSDDGYVNLTVKNISLGTDIKDQKQRVQQFIAEIEPRQV